MALLLAAAGSAVTPMALAQTVFYAENFESAVRNQLSGDSRVTQACATNIPAFTHTPPAGWDWNACGVSSYHCRVPACGGSSSQFTCGSCTNVEGVFEWEGWSFTSKSFWGVRTDNQNRQQFTLGRGNVAVADGDEWDDRGNPDTDCGYYNAWMKTKPISLENADLSTLAFSFDSSWRPEGFDDGRDASNNQTAIIRAIYTVGGVDQAPVEVLHWDSDDGIRSGTGTPSAFNKGDATNESVVLTPEILAAPAGASAVRFEFGYVNAANDWWWAIDNLVLTGNVSGAPATLFSENFDSLPLQGPVNEVPSGCGITYCGVPTFTHVAPNGASVIVDSPATGGVPDWRGWSFVARPFWLCCSGGPNGAAFTNSNGIIAVADGDEFDDISHSSGVLDTTLQTPAIDVSSRQGNTVVLSFDSSWRWESGQTASVTAEFNDAAHTVANVLQWESNPQSAFFKPDAVNERSNTGFQVPAGATSVTLKFRYVGGNNWWWAIDNISVFEGVANVNIVTNSPNASAMAVAPSTDSPSCFSPWSPSAPVGWTNDWQPVGSCPADCGRPEWRGWTFANKDWWSFVAQDQERSLFTRASGFVAIADPDEWDDAPNGRSEFNAFLTTPSIALPSNLTSAALSFDSSWRPEGFDDACSCNPNTTDRTNNQTAIVKAFYTVGGVEQAPVNVIHWDSDDGSHGAGNGQFFKPDAVDEAVSLDRAALQIPAGAQSVRFEYSLTHGRNDWWWAIDNVAFSANDTSLFSENFEGVPNKQAGPAELPPSAAPAPNACQYFSTVAAQGGNLTVDNAGLAGCNINNDFYGFNAWRVDAWAQGAGGGDRYGFHANTAYVSDISALGCGGTTKLNTPNYAIGGLNPGSVVLSFRSSWGAMPGHNSKVEISFNNGPFVTVLNWTTANKSTAPDEVVNIPLFNPFGANTVKARFTDGVSGWWAITNFQINGQVGQTPCPLCAADFNSDGGVDGQDIEAFFTAWEGGTNCGDVNQDGGVDGSDIESFFAAWESGGC